MERHQGEHKITNGKQMKKEFLARLSKSFRQPDISKRRRRTLKLKNIIRSSLLTIALTITVTGHVAFAQSTSSPDYQPQVGQDGKDVIWVPTPQGLVDKMLDMAKVTAKDFVIDLGSGDGRTVITAAKRGAKALGIEYNPEMVELSKRTAAKEGVSDKASFIKADLFESDFSQAQVVTMFLLSSINLKLRPKILDLKPGTRIASNTFDMGDWKPDETASLPGCNSWCTAHLWIVPAKVEGRWTLPQGELRQSRSVRERFLPGSSDHYVSLAGHQYSSAAEDPRSEAGHAHRFQLVHHGRLEFG